MEWYNTCLDTKKMLCIGRPGAGPSMRCGDGELCLTRDGVYGECVSAAKVCEWEYGGEPGKKDGDYAEWTCVTGSEKARTTPTPKNTPGVAGQGCPDSTHCGGYSACVFSAPAATRRTPTCSKDSPTCAGPFKCDTEYNCVAADDKLFIKTGELCTSEDVSVNPPGCECGWQACSDSDECKANGDSFCVYLGEKAKRENDSCGDGCSGDALRCEDPGVCVPADPDMAYISKGDLCTSEYGFVNPPGCLCL